MTGCSREPGALARRTLATGPAGGARADEAAATPAAGAVATPPGGDPATPARQVRAPVEPEPEYVEPFVSWAAWDRREHRPLGPRQAGERYARVPHAASVGLRALRSAATAMFGRGEAPRGKLGAAWHGGAVRG